MGPEIAIAVLLVAGLLILLLLGLEIGWAIGIVAVVGLTGYIDQPISQVAETAWSSLNSFTLTAMPLFIFMGTILGNTGVNERLFAAIDKWFGHFPGGLAISVIAGNAIFGAMCGSAMAATATFGKIAFPVMEKYIVDYLWILAGHIDCRSSGSRTDSRVDHDDIAYACDYRSSET